MRVVVTGGAGFIGSNFVHYFVEKYPDAEVVVVDKLTYAGDLRNLEGVLDSVRFVRADISDLEALVGVFRDPVDILYHFAAETHVDNSIKQPGDFLRTNVFGTYTLLELSRKYDVGRFLYVSTDEVYGSIDQGYFSEEDPLDPSSPYSASKAAGEMFVNAYRKTYGLDTVITRSSNNFGPRQYPEKLIPKTIRRALNDEPIPIYGDGSQVRDWIFVEDNCSAIDIASMRGKSGDVFNIGANNEHTNLEVVRMILAVLGKPESLITFVSDRPGHDRRYALDTAKIRAMGWTPRWRFEDALRYTIEWYLSNKWALEKRDTVV